MLTVHHLGVSQSERITWLCEELAVPYKLQRYDREPSGRAPENYKALHPMGIAPIITDGALVLAESGAIVQYIIAKYGNGRLAIGPDQPNFADYLFWFHFANGTMMPSQMSAIFSARLGLKDGDPMMAAMKHRSDLSYALVERRLGQVPFFAGQELTAADIMMFFSLSTMRAYAQQDLAAFPNLRAYLQRIGARPAYRQAMQQGDPNLTPRLA